ncbi:MAG: hypothetical protein ACW98F_00030 [Candidatus Hodarchaeales archaeon]|jgi:hypothetical protein
MSDGYAGVFSTHPPTPSGIQLTEIGDTVEVEWYVPAGEENYTHYEVWSSVGDETEYSLIAKITKDEVADSGFLKILDLSYDRQTILFYRIYSARNEYRGVTLSGNITLTWNVPDPTDLTVAADSNSFTLNWVNDDSRLLKEVVVIKDSDADSGNLYEASGIEVYRGLAETFTYQVSGIQTDWYQFWVSSVTRT